jgi:D-glycero-alpha-D-manno-heptose 1-phosphate guanylyltransferase
MRIESIILAGGLGTRLRECVPDLPKPLAPINGTPFLDILLKQMRTFPVSSIVLAVGYKAEHIQDHYKGHSLIFSVEDKPLGTGGALKKALALTTSDHVLVLNGDSFLDIDFAAFWQQHQETRADLTLACLKMEDAGRYGSVSFEEDTGRIRSFTEPSSWINGGVYLMQRDLLKAFPDSFSLEKEAFPALLHKNLYGFPCEGTFIDIGTKSSFCEAQQLLKAFI